MKREYTGLAIAGVALITAASALATTVPETSGPAKDGSPAWHIVKPVAQPRPAPPAPGAPRPVNAAVASQVASLRLPACGHSTICGRKGGFPRNLVEKVEWDQNLGYTVSYPLTLPSNIGGAPGAALDSKGNIWVIQRNPVGTPQLFKFDKDYKLKITVGEDVIGHTLKSHALAVDRDDNVWLSDADGSVVLEVSPEGKLLLTLGTRNTRGDWDESKGQHLLWQPASLAFGPNGDVYIGEGHANESPNDVDSDDTANNIGAARVLHLDHDGKFINQWFGDEVGQGKFDQVHALAVDPKNGDVWIGDREQYRFVVYTGDGQFIKTIQMRNLTCGLIFDPQGNPWMTSGMDGQVLKIDRDGKVLGAIGGGSGTGDGQFNEANYFAMDKQGNIYVGDTGIARVTKFTAPKK
jgi:hypothetical protein